MVIVIVIIIVIVIVIAIVIVLMMMMMMMQANEWGKRYQFWSCADVDIMPPNNFAQVNSHDDS